MKKRAFTLIELLVVIAIIAILAAILFPVFAKARERAKLTTCISNQKQLATAVLMYVQDADDRMPPWANNRVAPQAPFNTVNASESTWDVLIYPYVKTKQAFTCPSSTKHSNSADWPIRSYSFPRNISLAPSSVIKAPSKTVLLFEKGAQVVGAHSDATGEWFGQLTDGTLNPLANSAITNPDKWGFFHSNGKTFSFVDGHAAWYRGVFASPAPSADQQSSNPLAYNFPGNPATGRDRFGYCGGRTLGDLGVNLTTPDWGSNLPQ